MKSRNETVNKDVKYVYDCLYDAQWDNPKLVKAITNLETKMSWYEKQHKTDQETIKSLRRELENSKQLSLFPSFTGQRRRS